MTNHTITPSTPSGPAAGADAAGRGVTLPRRALMAAWKPVVFAVLLWLSSAAGQIPVPGSPTPITLQTFVVMMAGLMLTWRQAGAAVLAYLAAGAAGLPVFAGGASTAALFGPSAGFLLGFLPGAMLTAWISGNGLESARRHAAGHGGEGDGSSTAVRAASVPLSFARYLAASLIGCVAVVYAFGFVLQSLLLHMPLPVVAAASASFIVGDVVKAAVASLVVTGLVRLR